MKIPPQLIGGVLATAIFIALIAWAWDAPGDVSGLLIPRKDRDRILHIFLHSEIRRKEQDGTVVIEKRFRVPSKTVDISDMAENATTPEPEPHGEVSAPINRATAP